MTRNRFAFKDLLKYPQAIPIVMPARSHREIYLLAALITERAIAELEARPTAVLTIHGEFLLENKEDISGKDI